MKTLTILKTDYHPSLDRLEELKLLQNWFNETRLSIMIECKYDEYHIMLRSQQLANALRDKFKLLPGKEELSCKDNIDRLG
tara:strand:+ start:19 stop:261 length:243 start_codon:yes stop_codon:yes gene_type:complete